MLDIDIEGGAFKKIHQLINEKFLPYQDGVFTADKVWYHFRFDKRKYPTESGFSATQIREALDQVLYYKTKVKKTPDLERVGNGYRVINRESEELDFWNTEGNAILDLKWPYGREDDTDFQLHNVEIYQGSPVVVSGGSNYGKSAFLLNFAIANMGTHPILYMTNEWTKEQAADRLRPFGYDLSELKGKIRFIKRFRDWQDAVEPGSLNLIDYLRTDDATQVGGMINRIKESLDGRGMAMIALQKQKGRDEGFGGDPTKWDAQLYLSIDYQKLTIVKAKSFNGVDLNNKKFSFRLVEKGSQFHDIVEITD